MNGPLPIVPLLLSFAGGLALFVYGMRMLGAGLRKAAAGRISRIISTVTGNRLTALFAGALATVTVQSSGLVMVTLIGLVQSGIISFPGSLGIILGSEIGTTTMAQLIASAPDNYGLQIFAAGLMLSLAGRRPAIRITGEVLSGLGLLFFGLHHMGDAVIPLRTHPPFLALLSSLQSPLPGVLAGIVATTLIQSSGAFMGILISLGLQGAVTLDTAIPLMIGANIGSCVMAGIGSIGTIRAAKRVFLAQLMFNVAGAAMFLWFIPAFSDLVRAISPPMEAGGLARQIANAHSIYNLLLAIIFLPLLKPFAGIIERLLPDDPEEKGKIPSVWYLRNSALATPLVALGFARAEAARMTKILGRMIRALPHPFLQNEAGRDVVYGDLNVLEGLRMREEKLDYLEGRVTEYLIRILKADITGDETHQAAALMTIVKELEAAGDVVEMLLDKLQREWLDDAERFSEEGREEIGRLHTQVCLEIAALTPAVLDMDGRRARAILNERPVFHAMFQGLEFSHLKRIRKMSVSEKSHGLHMELLMALETIHRLSMQVAETIVKTSEVAPS
ncbi:MAG: Na/Pi cotransporter family protein [Chlorobiaceae bacterium]|nr:Na/Pi cotransporter family protein [Chlorobiaceae bacterium]NTW74061.1 Na/Pi cotransporter family protein [Chlorobiaceae bacterium]